MDISLAAYIIAGGVLGEGMRRLTRRLIQNRTGQPALSPLLKSRWSPFLWILAGALTCGFTALYITERVSSIEYMGIFLILLSVTIIDISIRKIPNELLIMLLGIKLAAVAASLNPSLLLPAFFGLLAGLALFLVPLLIGVGVGWGDVKLAAAAGFCLGMAGILQATIIMAAVMGCYLLYLIATKKGNRKTKAALGPSLSIGMTVALLFPLASAI